MDLDKLREKAQAAKMATSITGWTYGGIVGDAFRLIAAADPTTVLALIDRLQKVETALQEIAEDGCDNEGLDPDLGDCLSLESPVPCGSCIARAALEGGSDAQ